MPHTWIVWGRYAECVQPHSYTRNECYSFILWSRKLPHFQQGVRKTLSNLSAILRLHYKYRNYFSIVAVLSAKIFNFAEISSVWSKEYREFKEFNNVPIPNLAKFIKLTNFTKNKKPTMEIATSLRLSQ